MGLKIIHCADVHFDSAMSGIGDATKVNIRRNEMKETFSEIIKLSAKADLLLISGDLFDGKNVSKNTLSYLKEEFLKIPETKVFICAGNHDYISENSPYRQFDFGENVHIFGTEMECISYSDYDVYGISFKAQNDAREMLSGFSVRNSEKINICVMHGDVGGTDYNPIKVKDIEKSGLDYLALGHIHKASAINRAGSTHYAYPGCIEGRGNDETGEKGIYALEVIKGNVVNCEFVPVCRRMYIDEEVDITGATDYNGILGKINEIYKGENHIYRFTLTGKTEVSFDTAVIEEKIAGFSVIIRDKTVPAQDLEKASEEFSLKGLFLKYALSEKGELTEEEFNDAIKAGLYYIEKEENNENR